MSTEPPSNPAPPTDDDAAEKQWNTRANRLVLILLYSLVILSIGANLRVWNGLFESLGWW